MKNKPQIISVEYSMNIGSEAYELIWNEGRNHKTLSSELKDAVPAIRTLSYPITRQDTILIKFTTSSVEEFEPKNNMKTWQTIAKIIEDHINRRRK